ncbi:MAG TPA: hypothetical protein VE991_04180, partial [Acidimicrobiales bacterium]|nr:hypothetical protein [Acidimicrobiales bacterium]
MVTLIPTAEPVVDQPTTAAPAGPVVRLWEVAVLLGYGILLGSGVAHHEPWSDEVQSWLLARDASVVHLFAHQLRYEGSPGLWQLLLVPFAKAGLPVLTLNVVGAAVAFAGVAIVLFASPLPAPLRAALPFTYYFAFQYAVVARSYTLFVPLVLGVAACHRTRMERPLRYTVLLCLLSAVAVEAMVVAGVLFVLLLAETARRSVDIPDLSARIGGSLLLFFAVELFFVAVLWPTHDNKSPLASALVLAPGAVWAGARSVLDVAYVGVPWLNYVILVFACIWLYTRRALLFFVLPTTAAVVFSAVKLHQLWFDGLLTMLLVAAVWVALDNEPRPVSWPAALRRWDDDTIAGAAVAGVIGVLAVVCVVQIGWTTRTYAWDAGHAYAPGPAAAQWLRDHGLAGAPVATVGDYWAVDLEPYLPSGRFSNLGDEGAYFSWSRTEVPLP